MRNNSPMYVLGFMAIMCTLCGIAVSSVQFTMKQTLDTNAELARNRTVASAFGLSVRGTSAQAYSTALNEHVTSSVISDGNHQWQIYTTAALPRQIGIVIKGIGFWDYITCILVLSGDLKTIHSFEVIEQKETPGLGARIEEPSFKRQFARYAVDWNRSADRPIVIGEAAGGATSINAITGATQTSMALEHFLNAELSAFKKAYDKQGGIGSVSGKEAQP